jgi:hypothetical protein
VVETLIPVVEVGVKVGVEVEEGEEEVQICQE